jgi:hypothetical protein
MPSCRDHRQCQQRGDIGQPRVARCVQRSLRSAGPCLIVRVLQCRDARRQDLGRDPVEQRAHRCRQLAGVADVSHEVNALPDQAQVLHFMVKA